MKRLIIDLLLVALLAGVGYASEIGYRVEKAVNAGWQHSYIINYTIGGAYQVYLNTEAVFLAPRSNPWQGNHEYFGADIGGQVKVLGLDVLAGTGSRYYWSGNSAGLPEGTTEWINYFEIVKRF